ncbi:hypothetical protein B0A67_15580, partial [Flavobacterium aquidurense]|uniref:hypothetical protein n=1 Tax=Flavobacterium aquidurense TaxID=362413 RepID=UPI000B5B8C6D
YNLTSNIINAEIDEFNEFYEIGKIQNNKTKKSIQENLNHFTSKNGVISGTDLQKNWFPEVKSHIFLSHSHKDEKIAIILAGILYEIFNIETFIDSNVWGYSNHILKQIDNTYCKNTGQNTYNYDKRNYSTSHINLILSTALNKMIDNSECIFFLNTPNSITPASIIDKTTSPWIFSEIATTQIIRKVPPKRLNIKDSKYSAQMKALNENLKIEYDIELSHLTNLNENTLWEWFKKDCNSPENALDQLYSLTPLSNKFL